MEACRAVRVALSLTQTEFARSMGRTLSTVQRYEGSVPPSSADTLALYAKLAERKHLLRQLAIFIHALSENLGADVIDLLVRHRSPPKSQISEVSNAAPGNVLKLANLDPALRTSIENLMVVWAADDSELKGWIGGNLVVFAKVAREHGTGTTRDSNAAKRAANHEERMDQLLEQAARTHDKASGREPGTPASETSREGMAELEGRHLPPPGRRRKA